MDACTYESITGLKNYYGFKSLLKNGTFTGRYSCDDDTIVFNRIESFTFTNATFVLNANQVGVVLNLNCQEWNSIGNVFHPEGINTVDVDGQTQFVFGTETPVGVVLIDRFTKVHSNATLKTLVLAIFDLF
jgi:hypothetical protein